MLWSVAVGHEQSVEEIISTIDASKPVDIIITFVVPPVSAYLHIVIPIPYLTLVSTVFYYGRVQSP